MFGYYDKGLTQQEFTSIYDIDSLVGTIRENTFKGAILQLHTIPYKSDDYKSKKAKLPYITPHGIFRKNKSDRELIQLSGYIYFDIDANDIKDDVRSYIRYIVETYKDYIHLAGISVGGRGIFLYLKVNGLTKDNFKQAYEYFRTVVFKDLPIDNNAKGIHRSQFIPYDEQLYYNKNVSVSIPKDITDNNRKSGHSMYKYKKSTCYTLSDRFIPVNTILSKFIFETQVDVGDNLFIIEPLPYHKIYFPKKIEDGKKHTTFRAITQGLMFLNPDITLLEVQSYIHYINHNHTTVSMKTKEMMNTVAHEYKRVKETGDITIEIRSKVLHFNKNAKMHKEEKRCLANKLNGLIKKYHSVKLIEEAIIQLGNSEATTKTLSAMTKLGEKTIRRNKDVLSTDIANEILSHNRTIVSGVSDSQIQDQKGKEYTRIEMTLGSHIEEMTPSTDI